MFRTFCILTMLFFCVDVQAQDVTKSDATAQPKSLAAKQAETKFNLDMQKLDAEYQQRAAAIKQSYIDCLKTALKTIANKDDADPDEIAKLSAKIKEVEAIMVRSVVIITQSTKINGNHIAGGDSSPVKMEDAEAALRESEEKLADADKKLAEVVAKQAPAGNGPDLIESTIDGEFNGWEGETIFKLSNGQIWQQATYAYTYHYAFRPKAFIVKTNGAYKMKVDGVDDTIYVKRLK